MTGAPIVLSMCDRTGVFHDPQPVGEAGREPECDPIAVADRCAWSGAPWMLENPVSTISSYWRKPDHTFDPCDYGAWVDGDAYVKKTCLWTGNGFIMPPPNPVAPVLGSKMHLLPPTEDRGDLRSVTPAGFARAVFEANENGITTVDDIAPVGLFGSVAT